MFKRKISIMVVLMILAAILSGCSLKGHRTESERKDGSGEKINVVATIFPSYDFVCQIAGEQAEVKMLLSPGAESHSYEPSPQDIIAIQKCDVFIYTGGESDEWLNDILDSIDTGSIKIVSLMDCVEAVEEERKEGMEAEGFEKEHNHGEEKEPEYDEHVWTSPQNAVLIVEKVCETLCEADEANAELYRLNAESYIDKLNELDNEFKETVQNARRKLLVFGDRFPLRYFVEAYDLDYYAAFPGCASDTEPSAATMAFLVDKVKEENIPVVFKIELSNGNVAQAISEAAGARVMTFYSCHNISKDDFLQGADYLSLMEKNVESLKEALN